MATLTIRNVDAGVKARLRQQAAEHGRSVEAEVRAILEDAVRSPGPTVGLATSIRRLVDEHGGADLELPSRTSRPRDAGLPS